MKKVQKTKRFLSLFLVLSLVIGLIVPGFAPDVVAEGNAGEIASVNGQAYPSLQAAIDGAGEGDTVKLLVDRTESVTIKKALTIDLEGHKLTSASTGTEIKPAFTIDNATVTVKNGEIIGGRTRFTSQAGAIKADRGGFNLEDLTISGTTGPGYAISIANYSGISQDLEINNLTISGNQAHAINGGTKDNLTFTNCHFDNNTPEGDNCLVRIGGRGKKVFKDCTFLNNKAQGILYADGEYIHCRIEENESYNLSIVGGENYTLTNTVVKNNINTFQYAAAGVDVSELTLNNSAIYNNKNTAGGMNDLGQKCRNIDVTKMKDPTDPSKDFSDYVVDEKGTVVYKKPTFEAEINGKKYKTLSDAIEGAQPGETIKLINTNEAGDPIPVHVPETIYIDDKVTIDFNGRDITSGNWWPFGIRGDKADFSLVNTDPKIVELGGSPFVYDMNQRLYIGDRIRVTDDIWHNPKTTIDGSHDRLSLVSDDELNDGKTMPINFGPNFKYTGKDGTLKFSLAKEKEALNDEKTEVADFVIAHGASPDLVKKISLKGVTNPMVRLVFKPDPNNEKKGDLLVHKEASTVIYWDGQNGDDSHQGESKDKAVKTFARAKEVAEELAKENPHVIVYMMNTVKVEGKEKWEVSNPDKITFYREPSFSGYLVEVTSTGDLTLENMTIDGNNKVDPVHGSLVFVNGGKLTIGNGGVLQNNRLVDEGKGYPYPSATGGAVFAKDEAVVTLDGGRISGNEAVWGGGIFSQGKNLSSEETSSAGTQIIIRDGIITDNHAVNSDGYTAAGGGIATWYQTKLVISGGEISKNTSEKQGGGISLGTPNVVNNGGYSELEMTGGSLLENTARSSGGGLFIQGSNYKEGYARANIKAGLFQGNKALGGIFSGGGIYVNGGHNRKGYSSGKLYLTNAVITDNRAGDSGGGYAACPSSNTEIYVNEGAAIFGNDADKSGKDLHIDATILWGGINWSPKYEISESMLGGAPYHWTFDDGKEAPLSYLHGVLRNAKLNLNSQGPGTGDNSVKDLAKVTITGNYAGANGGGIGSNGDVIIGKKDTIDVTVNKTWKDNEDKTKKRPESVMIGLYR